MALGQLPRVLAADGWQGEEYSSHGIFRVLRREKIEI